MTRLLTAYSIAPAPRGAVRAARHGSMKTAPGLTGAPVNVRPAAGTAVRTVNGDDRFPIHVLAPRGAG